MGTKMKLKPTIGEKMVFPPVRRVVSKSGDISRMLDRAPMVCDLTFYTKDGSRVQVFRPKVIREKERA